MSHISLVTLGVEDLDGCAQFYERLGWRRSPASVVGVVVFLEGGVVPLSLFKLESYAGEVGLPVADVRTRGSVTLAMNVHREAEVAEILASAEQAGGVVTDPASRADWGGVSGHFADPEGHLWEVAHNPFFPLHPDGRIELPRE